MTLIVYNERGFTADLVASVGGRKYIGESKLHIRGNLVWGSSGFSPTRRMRAATSIDELVDAIIADHLSLGDMGLLVTDDNFKNVWSSSLKTNDKDVNQVPLQRQDPGYAIGCYYEEWFNTLARWPDADPASTTELVFHLSGMKPATDGIFHGTRVGPTIAGEHLLESLVLRGHSPYQDGLS